MMVKVRLGKFMREGLERREGGCLEESVRAAVVEFVERVERGHLAISPPLFLPRARRSRTREVEVDLDARIEAILRSEATRLRTSADRLAAHAVMVSLAELESLESLETRLA
jgi:hypothetical protein